MDTQDMGWSDEKRQSTTLAVILTMGQADIQAGNFRDVEEFFAELEAEYPATS
ncbi:hypothetical protein ACRHQ6_27335 [Burkholderia pseudomallei]|uniref:hypothetical protein n=1 Tax=Burkholderia pseudomallei TaxID=28450 RepID=UPI004058F50D